MAINAKIHLKSFIDYMVHKIKVFKDDTELNEMKELLVIFIFNYFDEGKLQVFVKKLPQSYL